MFSKGWYSKTFFSFLSINNQYLFGAFYSHVRHSAKGTNKPMDQYVHLIYLYTNRKKMCIYTYMYICDYSSNEAFR